MESSKWTEEEIQKQLEKMPPVKDKRSRELIFHEIEGRLEESKHSKKITRTWIMPGLAAACLLAIIMILVPGTLFKKEVSAPSLHENSMDNKMAGKAKDQVKEPSPAAQPKQSVKTARLEEQKKPAAPQERVKPSGPAKPETSADTPVQRSKVKVVAPPTVSITAAVESGKYHPPMTMKALNQQLSSGKSVVTVAYSDEQAQFVVPVSFLVNGKGTYVDKVENVLGSFNPERVGLQPTFLNKAKLTEKEGSVVVDLPPGSVSSAEEALLPKILNYTFAYNKEYSNVKFMTDDKPGYEFSNLGPKEEMDINRSIGGASYLYTSPSGDEFLVESNATSFADSAGSLQGALEQLSKGYKDQKLMPAVPDGIKLTATRSGTMTAIRVDGNDLKNDEETRKMMDAILVTAKNYGSQSVSVTNTDLEAVGPYDLEQPIDYVAGVNFMNVK
ncbi:hypothetical protein M1K46_22180 [Fictibacillus sp. WQ 8-8]|uniref:hypothetical protein n=1 Tax=Fictibacillus sp. WQ 8-8 TaxID=2938788 RepID=UPI0021092E51|nr:hypothetical protein [Fictibacillus sp. WQ 8-8]MCQ6268310.1 hypothetical protein [Fictibacillus sp. WQ 8-8]